MKLEKVLKIILRLVSLIAMVAAIYSLITKENIFVPVILAWIVVAMQFVLRRVDKTSTKKDMSVRPKSIIIGFIVLISITYIIVIIC